MNINGDDNDDDDGNEKTKRKKEEKKIFHVVVADSARNIQTSILIFLNEFNYFILLSNLSFSSSSYPSSFF